MAKNDLSPFYSSRMLAPPVATAPAPTTRTRDKSPDEALGQLYVGIARTRTARGVTAYAIDSLGVVADHRRHVVEEFPEVTALADLLITNMVRIMGGIQNSIINDDARVIV